jgi:lysophospholipase L1-like esterase
MRFIYMIICFLSTLAIHDCHDTGKDLFIVKGRTESTDNGSTILIGSGSSVTFSFTGSKCAIKLQAKDTYEHHNFVSLELNGIYLGRVRIGTAMQDYAVEVPQGNAVNVLTVYKATEAANGSVIFGGTTAAAVKTVSTPMKKIEFIGDSITCGMGADIVAIPCDTGEWYDQHNAYYAYGPTAARQLNADFLLSSVSGIGMYRNWNDEHKDEPIMPDVYNNLYLNTDSSKTYTVNYEPNVTCIALGTNDFSDGDSKKTRLPFDAEKYVANYIAFVKMIYSRTPGTKLVLLNSPMVSGDKNSLFINCLKRVQQAFPDKDIQVFEFSSVTPQGCGYHPDIDDHKLMANQLAPFLKQLLDEK